MTMRAHALTRIALLGAIALGECVALAVPPSRVEVSGLRVRVGDVIRDAPATVADVDLGPAPQVGGSRVIGRAQILEAVRARDNEAHLRLPEAVRVVRRMSSLTPGDLERMVRDALPASRLPRGATLAAVRAPRAIELPAGWTSVTAELPRPPRRTGAFTTAVMMTLRLGDEVIARASVPVELALSAEAAAPDVARGGPLTLLVREGLVEVRVGASAAIDADVGDTLPVLLRPSGRVLRARLIERNLALAVEGP